MTPLHPQAQLAQAERDYRRHLTRWIDRQSSLLPERMPLRCLSPEWQYVEPPPFRPNPVLWGALGKSQPPGKPPRRSLWQVLRRTARA